MARKIFVLNQETGAGKELYDKRHKMDVDALFGGALRKEHSRIAKEKPDLIVAELHQMDALGWHIARQIRAESPNTHFLFTTRYSDEKREKVAQARLNAQQVSYPVTWRKIGQAFERFAIEHSDSVDEDADLPKVAMPIRNKIAFPYGLLALALALGAIYLGFQFVTVNIQERFNNQLIETAQLTADWMAREEQSQLETMRLAVNTNGVQDAIVQNDAEALRELVVPLAVNSQEEAIEILDPSGESVMSLRHRPGGNVEEYLYSKGDDIFAEWDFVQKVMNGEVDDSGDKFAGIAQADWGDFLYIAGPINNADGDLIGVILIGGSLSNLARDIREETLAQISIYDKEGNIYATTLPQEPQPLGELAEFALANQDTQSQLRDFGVGSIEYSELVGPWEARNGEDIGVIGSALSQLFVVQATRSLKTQTLLLIALAFLAILLAGILVAKWITDPIGKIIRALSQVSNGNLNVSVQPTSNDEMAVLGYAFNQMVEDLREGEVYRDLLGRAVTPEVRELLRQQLQSGDLRLEGQKVVATVLYSDIRGFTSISEELGAENMFVFLNQYLEEVIPTITAQGGVVNEFAGDALVAVFGALPRQMPANESAYNAVNAALAMEAAIIKLNKLREAESQPMFITGIGITTGNVVFGAVGSVNRLHFSVVGDPVNTAHRLQEMNKAFGETSVIASEETVRALGTRASQFHLDSLGEIKLRGKETDTEVFRLRTKDC